MNLRALVLAFATFGTVACQLPPGTENGGTSSGSSSSGSGATGTSGSRKPINEDVVCTRLIEECFQPLSKPDCRRTFGSLRVTDACLSALEAAPCNALTSTTSEVSTTCFPPCSGTVRTCNADGTLTFCTPEGTTRVADCGESCVFDGYSKWTGVCGTSHDGQTVDAAQCWCE